MLARATSRSHLGRVLVGLRDAESRTRFLGCRVEHDKLVVWIVSAMMADALVGAALGAMTVALAGPLLTGWLPDAWTYRWKNFCSMSSTMAILLRPRSRLHCTRRWKPAG